MQANSVYSGANFRLTPWHELGTNIKNAQNSAAALKLAALDWEVHQAPVRYFDGANERIVDTLKMNYRADTGEPLGIITNRYSVVQNQAAFEFADQLTKEGIEYGFAGAIQNGCQVWCQVHFPERKILGDIFCSDLVIINSHDGKSALQVYMTPVRMVCANMLNLAIHKATRKWHLPHVRTVQGKMLDAKRTLRHADKYMDELNWRAETLAVEKLARNDLRRFIEKMFPSADTDRKNNRIKRKIERFHECYFADDIENFKDTKWGLLLAVSDYVTHIPLKNTRQRERHFSQMMEGHELLDKAFSLINTM